MMAILIFALSLGLLIAAAACGYQSLNLLPTGIGVLYAVAGAVAACVAVLTFAIGILIRRIDALARLVRQSATPSAVSGLTMAEMSEASGGDSAAPPTAEEEAAASADETSAAEDESPVNINRAGRLPSLETGETVQEGPAPKRPPSLIGSYSSAGANYKIFSDGSIEAETGEGTFSFASMADFKRHLAETKAGGEA